MAAPSEAVGRIARALFPNGDPIYNTGQNDAEILVDVLTDLRHWADEAGLGDDFAALLAQSYRHYKAERDKDDGLP